MAQLTTYVCDGCGSTCEHGSEGMREWFRIEMVIYCQHGPNQTCMDICADCGAKFSQIVMASFPVKYGKDESEARH
jgi:hypothetical protein